MRIGFCIFLLAAIVGIISGDGNSRAREECQVVTIWSPKDSGVYTLDEFGGINAGGFYWDKSRKVILKITKAKSSTVVFEQYAFQDQDAEPPVWWYNLSSMAPGFYDFEAILVDGYGGEPLSVHKVYNVELVAPECGNKRRRGEWPFVRSLF